ncbi:MAG: ATP-binding protein [Gammaproteobacteria bacterium]
MRMLNEGEDFSKRYRESLRNYLAHGGEQSLHQAYELGRAALEAGYSLLELVNLHCTAAAGLIGKKPCSAEQAARKTTAAGRFLVESLSSFEVLQIGNRESNAALKRLNAILEEEAKRIAHVLHDEAAQLLASAYLELAEILHDAPDAPTVRTRVERVTAHLDQVREHLRRLSHELRPPILDQLGLLPALEFLADGYRKRSGLDVSVQGALKKRLVPEAETALYRVVQEALNNITRHAQAHCVGVRVWREANRVHCTVADDGIGFDQKAVLAKTGAKGLGIIGIQERVSTLHGTLDIRSTPGAGTELRISVPCGSQT